MAQNNYDEYFKTLEKRLSDNSGNKPAPTRTVTSRSAKHSSRGHRSISRAISAVAIFLAVALIAVIAVIAVKAVLTPKPDKTGSESSVAATSSLTVTEEEKVPLISYSFTDETAEIPADNDAEAAIVIDLTTHNVVAARAADERLYPASTTKVMTLLVAQENIKNYEDTFTMTTAITDPLYVAEATVAGFLDGEIINMTDLLYGTILPSGADAAVGLATKLAGGEAQFVELMNKKASELGLKNTHFTNVTGLFDKDHYTSAYDMAVILETAIQNPLCRKILSTYQYKSSPTNKHPDGVAMSATLFNNMYGTEPETATIIGGKTGFVNESGYCIASFGNNNTTGNEYIAVTLKNSSRWPAFHGQINLYARFAK